MATVTYNEYNEAKMSFFDRHDHTYKTSTSPMIDDVWHKEYVFEDGAIWYERYEHVYIPVTVDVMRCKVDVEVEMLKNEFWSTDNSKSREVYSQW